MQTMKNLPWRFVFIFDIFVGRSRARDRSKNHLNRPTGSRDVGVKCRFCRVLGAFSFICRIRRHDAQVRLLAGDLAKAARHPIVEERPLGKHSERPDIRALGRTRGTDLFDVTICHPLSEARIRDAVQNPLNILKAVWAGKVSRYATMVHEAGRSVQLLPVPISRLGGWHPDANRALCSVATTIPARGMSTFSAAKSILFQRHAALLVTNNALCLMSGLLSGI